MACCSSDTQSVRLEKFVPKEIQDLVENGHVFKLGTIHVYHELFTAYPILGLDIKANLARYVTYYWYRLARK